MGREFGGIEVGLSFWRRRVGKGRIGKENVGCGVERGVGWERY
jgi:hypothetical protein